MTIVRTSLGQTIERARNYRFEPIAALSLTATNVQKAIEEAASLGGGGGAVTTRVVTATPDVAVAADALLLMNVASAAALELPNATLWLAAHTSYQFLVVKDISGAAFTNNISITPGAGNTIQGGVSPLVIGTNFGGYALRPQGTVWYIMG